VTHTTTAAVKPQLYDSALGVQQCQQTAACRHTCTQVPTLSCSCPGVPLPPTSCTGGAAAAAAALIAAGIVPMLRKAARVHAEELLNAAITVMPMCERLPTLYEAAAAARVIALRAQAHPVTATLTKRDLGLCVGCKLQDTQQLFTCSTPQHTTPHTLDRFLRQACNATKSNQHQTTYLQCGHQGIWVGC